MSKGIIIFISFFIIISVLYFSFQYFYLKPIKNETKINFDKKNQIVTFSFKNPVPKNYFLKNFKIVPEAKGEFVFRDQLEIPFNIFVYKEVQFIPENLEMGQTYKIKNFEKEFSFSLPSPRIKEISFDEKKKEIEITFFESIKEDYFFKNLRIEPELKGEYVFLDSNTKVIFRPEKIEEDKNYYLRILDKDLSFKIESPKVKEIYFDKATKEIVTVFTKSIEKERFFEEFKVMPSLSGEVIFDDSQTKVVLKPDRIEEGENYEVEILGEKLGFKIEPLPKIEKKPVEKLEPKSQPPKNLQPKPQVVAKEKLIDINLSQQKLKLYQGEQIVGEYTTSTGKADMPTPTGTFRVLSKEKNHWSSQYSLYMPYALRFYNGFYIHELPYWPGGYREGEEHLGVPVSHGCVRIGIGAAEEVYNFADIGTKIVIHK